MLRRPGGRPGPGREGLGALAGQVAFARRCRKSRRTRAGDKRCPAAISPEEALGCACGLYLNDPTAWLPPPTNSSGAA